MAEHKLKRCRFRDHVVYYRQGTSDEKVLEEVITNRCYRRAKARFDVERGEHWLDLGANIGAFAVYCALRGATVTCYEPDPKNFKILEKNVQPPQATLHEAAVTDSDVEEIFLWQDGREDAHSRGTVLTESGHKGTFYQNVRNVHASTLLEEVYDGVKIDIEGGEFSLIDHSLIPPCRKLVLEYHTSRDQSIVNLRKRISLLKHQFDQVLYPAELDRLMRGDEDKKTFFDRTIFCINGMPKMTVRRAA